ncbi:M48 family metallopeptidase [Neobacillus niacini]|uniref:M48 family metallopeptidase n=1 Tax=Neobacillus niacini TaxID=86668 RepID=UPI0030033873
MMLDEKSLIHKSEKSLFIFSIIISVIAIIFLFVSVIGISILFGIALATLVSHSVSMAYIRLNGIQLSPNQFGDLYNRVLVLSKRFEIEEIPEVYIVESGGALNAFASRIFGMFGKNIVVLYSDIVELVEDGCEDELDFIIAHELAHVKRNHVVKQLLIFLAMWIPFLGEAYSRACEFTADRMAVACTEKPDKAIRALTVFAAGKRLYRGVNKQEYLNQYNDKKGFFISLTELLSTHPAIPRRIFEIEAQIGKSTVVLKKKSKAGVFAILISTILAGALFIWTGYSLIKDVINFTEGFLLPSEDLTEVMEATLNGDGEEVSRLLKEGADPNEQEPEGGMTALSLAADNDQLEAAQILVENGADPNLPDNYGYTPIMGAVFMENKEMVQLLLDAGADPTFENDEGMSAITYAEDFGYTELVELMTKAGN